jgi:hypothetical protein
MDVKIDIQAMEEVVLKFKDVRLLAIGSLQVSFGKMTNSKLK